MKIFLILLMAAAGVFLTLVLVNARRIARIRYLPDQKNLELQIDRLGQEFSQKCGGAGVVIGVIRRGRSYLSGYGNTEAGCPPGEQTVFEVPALAQLFTCICLLALADRGELSVSDNIRDYLPEEVSLPPHITTTTLQHLAVHTSGFPFLPKELRKKIKDEAQPYREIKREDIWNYLCRCSEKCRPGRVQNSDFGIGLLALLLEKKTGLTFSELVQRELCGPLGLRHTTLHPPNQEDEDLIRGHRPSEEDANYWNCGALYGAGAAYTNMEDMLAFLRSNLCPQEGALFRTLCGTHKKCAAGYGAVGWKTAHEYEKLFKLHDLLWIGGRTTGFSAYLAIDVKQNTAAAIFAAASVPARQYGTYLMHVISHTSFCDEGTSV